MRLSHTNHDRDIAGLQYIYPVVSRRAAGVSVGINLNPNNACNFRCIYCQVPNLVFGKGPPIDTLKLQRELHQMLDSVTRSEFMVQNVPEQYRRFNDVALSGNGEPTSSPQFSQTIDIIYKELKDFNLINSIKTILITNGTHIGRRTVQDGIKKMNRMNGEVWFKLDSATREGARRIHSVPVSLRQQLNRIRRSAEICPTWIQTCLFQHNDNPPSDEEQRAYLECLSSLVADAVPLRGVFLYTLARPSYQPEAAQISAVSPEQLQRYAQQVRATGMKVYIAT